MVKVDESFILIYKKEGQEFQVLVDYEKLLQFKKEENIDIYDVLADTSIYVDIKKGLLQSQNLTNEIFAKKTENEILKEILLKGECQIPTSFLNKKRDEIKQKVISYIVESCINPQTNHKFTPSMVESEVNKLKFNFDANKDYIYQAEQVIKKLQSNFPIKVDIKSILLSIPAKFTGKFYGREFRKLGKITKEYFDNHGALRIHMDVNSNNLDKAISYISLNTDNEAEYSVRKD